MKLSELLEGIEYSATGDVDINIEGVECDSRKVKEGYLFVALKGTADDGRRFVEDAIKRGGRAVVTEPGLDATPEVTHLLVDDARKTLATVAARLYGMPADRLNMVAITGTNGKTTVSYLLASIFEAAQKRCGIVGTTGYRWNKKKIRAELTTPDPITLQRILKEMAEDGVEYVLMEVSSHALTQKRVAGCRFMVRLFTNLTQDHLDYHGTMDDYFRAKRELFANPDYGRADTISVVNVDDPWGRRLKEEFKDATGYSLKAGADVYPLEYHLSIDGIRARLKCPRLGEVELGSSLIGEHNLYNLLAAVAVADGLGLSSDSIRQGVASLKGVPGRLEPLSAGNIRAYVDYAHTPDALERVCRVLKGFTKGRLITVFGCGGNRDRKKRPLMGAVAARHSDVLIVTSDNPREEEPMQIIGDIEEGLKGVERFEPSTELSTLRGYTVVPDREEAIRLAVNMAADEDTILVAGKGHEDYQIIKKRRYHFDDRDVLRAALADRVACRGKENSDALNS